MAFAAADVGPRIDLLLDGQGYIFDDTQEAKAEFGLSPIFVQRQNVQGDYGDNQQDFFLTFTQRDWSLGEQQKYVKNDDNDSVRRYRAGINIDVRVPGEAKSNFAAVDATSPINIATAVGITGSGQMYIFDATNRRTLNRDGTFGAAIAHGLGAAPSRRGAVSDGRRVLISTTGAGTVGVRDADNLTTFSATGADVLAFLNNTLYGLRPTSSGGDLIRYDTAGAVTSIFTWRDAGGTAITSAGANGHVAMVPYGGQLLILHLNRLWLSDGTAPTLVAELPKDFVADSLCVALGIAFVGGIDGYGLPSIMYWSSGTIGTLWTSNATSASSSPPQIVPFRNGIVFSDPIETALYYYNAAVGGISMIADYLSASPNAPILVATDANTSNFIAFVQQQNSTDVVVWPQYSGTTKLYASQAIVYSSLIDYGSSLTKNFHSVKLDFDLGTDGNGGSVDIAYRLNDVTGGGFTSIVTDATSGTEYTLPSVQGRSISIKVTLNQGTSTSGPTLKRLSVRASPVQPQYNQATYVIACYGTKRPSEPAHMEIRDGSLHPKTALQMVADLKTAAAKTTPITVIDEVNGSYSGLIQPETVKVQRTRPGEFRVVLTVRSI